MQTNKSKILWIVIIFLAVLNIATIGSVIHNNCTAHSDDESVIFEPGTQPINGKYFKHTLGFDEKQMDVFRESNHVFRQRANRIISEINNRKEELFIELQSEQPDDARLKEISANIGSLHAELKEATINFYSALNRVCTPKQKEQLNSVFTPLFQEVTIKGGRHGAGKNRNGNNQEIK